VAQGVGPEFKPQYCKKKFKKRKELNCVTLQNHNMEVKKDITKECQVR
jgi:hypothetical protein